METLDLLISKFKVLKEELAKNDLPSLNDTVDGFMSGLKALPKGSADRGKFITSHMNHGPFLSALKAHPQGQQIHSMLTTHLNSAANAGFKPGKTQVMAKSDDLEKAYISPYIKYGPTKPVKPAAPAPAPVETAEKGEHVGFKAMESKLEGQGHSAESAGKIAAAIGNKKYGEKRMHEAAAEGKPANKVKKGEDCLKEETRKSDYQSPKFEKTVNSSYAGAPNGSSDMMMSEEIKLDKSTGQWSLDKAYISNYYKYGPSKPAVKPASIISEVKSKVADKFNPPSVPPPANENKDIAEKGEDRERHSALANWTPPGKYGTTGSSIPQPMMKPAAAPAPKHQDKIGADKVKAAAAQPLEAMNAKVKKSDEGLEKGWKGKVAGAALAAASALAPSAAHAKPVFIPHSYHSSSVADARPEGTNSEGQKKLDINRPNTVKPAAPKVEIARKAEAENCSKCKKDPCVCSKGEGVLIDKMDGGDMSVGGGV